MKRIAASVSVSAAVAFAIMHASPGVDAATSTACNLYESNDPSGTTLNLTTGGTYYQWVSTTVGTQQGECVSSASSDNITVNRTGNYLVTFGVSFSGSANEEIDANVHVAGSPSAFCQLEQKLGSGTDVQRGAVVCLLSLTAGQTVDARFKAVHNSKSVVIKHASFSVVGIP